MSLHETRIDEIVLGAVSILLATTLTLLNLLPKHHPQGLTFPSFLPVAWATSETLTLVPGPGTMA